MKVSHVQQPSASICRQPGGYSSLLDFHNRGPAVSLVDVVPSHHCGLPQLKPTPLTCYICIKLEGVAIHTKINLLLRHFSCLYEHLHLPKFSTIQYTNSLKQYSVKMVTMVSVNTHALQTNQVTLADDAYLTGEYHEETGQTCL